MNPFQYNNGNNPNMNDINAVNQMILQNQYMIMNQINYLNTMNNQLLQNMNMMGNNMNNFNNIPNSINITFKSPNQQSLTININYDEKLSSVIPKYKRLINDSSNNKDYFFVIREYLQIYQSLNKA